MLEYRQFDGDVLWHSKNQQIGVGRKNFVSVSDVVGVAGDVVNDMKAINFERSTPCFLKLQSCLAICKQEKRNKVQKIFRLVGSASWSTIKLKVFYKRCNKTTTAYLKK